MDSDQFFAPPFTTGGLKATYLARGKRSSNTDIQLVHLENPEDVEKWVSQEWPDQRSRAIAAADEGLWPVFGFSCYTWNIAEFLELARLLKQELPGALIVAGGPHVQQAEDYLFDEAIDLIVLGEGEFTFAEILDCRSRDQWSEVKGCAFLSDEGKLTTTPERPRLIELDQLPSALEVVPLRDSNGEVIYPQAAYETSRGCPFRCAFCEWGTGAIGTKMYQFSLDRISRDFELLVAGGIKDIWLCDSNFGALREDLAKAEMIVDLKRRTGLPQSFATSWSKNHNKRVQDIVRLLHRNGLLSHYHLALQTLTPKALELSNRTNMRANNYEPVVKALASEGVPVAAELIWGLPGDTLEEFEDNLGQLMRVFPNINIFGYTLLPGTEFYDLREHYRLETIPVAGYGKAKGEYVVGCHTFDRDEGEEGYFLVASYIVLARGQIIPLVTQYLASRGDLSVGALMRDVLRNLTGEFADALTYLPGDRMAAYENRSQLYLQFLTHPEDGYASIRRSIVEWMERQSAEDVLPKVLKLLEIDRARSPRVGDSHRETHHFSFAADEIVETLKALDLPGDALFEEGDSVAIEIHHPGGAGNLLADPDGGEWMRGNFVEAKREADTDSEVSTRDDGSAFASEVF